MEAPKRVLFIDDVAPKLYHGYNQEGLGGTEITVAAVAQALGRKGFKVSVEVGKAHGSSYLDGVDWVPPSTVTEVDHVVCLRNPETLLKARERFPEAKLYLWCHDLFDRSMGVRLAAAVQATNPILILVVSDFHRAQIRTQLTGLEGDTHTRIRVSYPPIYDDLEPDSTPVDRNKLCFISSPHKGLEHALDLFKHLRRRENDLQLHVTNPGYYEKALPPQEGVKFHGSLSHPEVLTLVRQSLCLFFPNTVFPETFGRVYAEAEAVGTPVLTHSLGAASEVISDGRELVDCTNVDAVVERVLEWRAGRRPTVRMKRFFRLTRVINHWIREILK